MSTAPGAYVSRQTLPPGRSSDTDTGKLFFACLTTSGPTDEAVEVTSLAEFVTEFGARLSTGTGYDELDLFFREGGARAIVAQINPGTATVGTAHVQTALDLFNEDFGPGQVKVEGGTLVGGTATAFCQLVQAHAESFGRIALLDAPDTATVATLTAAGTATLRAATGARSAGLFAPHVTIPPLVSGGTARTVPPGALAAGIMARNDGQGITPNQAAAGDFGKAVYATGVSQVSWANADRATLNDAGVNVIRDMLAGVRIYGDRTLVDPDSDVNERYLSNSRYLMSLRARALEVLEGIVFRQIDGNGHLFGEVRGDLTGLLMRDFIDGALGAKPGGAFKPEEAFNIDYSANTPTTLANGEFHVTLAVQVSPPAEDVEMALVQVSITEAVA